MNTEPDNIKQRLEERREAAQADYDELTETLKRMRQMAAHNYPSKEQLNGGAKSEQETAKQDGGSV